MLSGTADEVKPKVRALSVADIHSPDTPGSLLRICTSWKLYKIEPVRGLRLLLRGVARQSLSGRKGRAAGSSPLRPPASRNLLLNVTYLHLIR